VCETLTASERVERSKSGASDLVIETGREPAGLMPPMENVECSPIRHAMRLEVKLVQHGSLLEFRVVIVLEYPSTDSLVWGSGTVQRATQRRSTTSSTLEMLYWATFVSTKLLLHPTRMFLREIGEKAPTRGATRTATRTGLLSLATSHVYA
jgi:hypothetical protein